MRHHLKERNTKYTVKMKTYLDLQEIITPNALIVHLVVGIVGITAALILDKGEPNGSVRKT